MRSILSALKAAWDFQVIISDLQGFVSVLVASLPPDTKKCTWYIAALFTLAKLQEQPRCPTVDEWVKKV
jgi:hypothetical protein